jgi:hypothetical protein
MTPKIALLLLLIQTLQTLLLCIGKANNNNLNQNTWI